ncbi:MULTISPECIES: phage baseplate plug family protein [unclassified Methylophaga]|jgi:hypothetical protein|uniref:phage baseplate plug family protein n=1 Tax=unclassified Methylophaga TaxID=2629249 RepID=UPI00259C90C2|nr:MULTISPECIES: hypothetical protein [unclassified Methylophaga]|tara:strand:- start:11932 stop:12225 length:294 start_codon:yes stop_codon:yes gene_type:complete
MITIPLLAGSENAHQQFSMQLGNNYIDFVINYVSYLDLPAWTVDLYRDGTPLVYGAMLEPNANIIEGYQLGIGSLVFIGEEVTLDNLGIDNALIWTP